MYLQLSMLKLAISNAQKMNIDFGIKYQNETFWVIFKQCVTCSSVGEETLTSSILAPNLKLL